MRRGPCKRTAALAMATEITATITTKRAGALAMRSTRKPWFEPVSEKASCSFDERFFGEASFKKILFS
jgi:hypothetical protein